MTNITKTIAKFLIFICCVCPFTYGQNFTRITTGSIVTDANSAFGASWADYDNDGDLDMFITTVYSENDVLYQNNGNGTFTKIASGPQVSDGVNSQYCSWADYDNDGFVDLFVTTGASGDPNFLYKNNGNGTFTKITSGSIVTDVAASSGAAWGDYDNDGYVDLFVANTGNDFLYHNNGNGTFTKITSGAIVTDGVVSSCAIWGDYDNDGYLDLWVGVGGSNCLLYKNNKNGTFSKITGDPVVSLSFPSSGGGSWGDFDNDGDLDLIVTYGYATSTRNNSLFINNGNGTFSDVTTGPIVTDNPAISVGTSWVDYDNDGDMDLYVCNTNNAFTTGPVNYLYQNNGNGNFTKITGTNLSSDFGNSRGQVWGDYDNDGDMDLFVANEVNEPNFLYQNNGNSNNWINIKLIGTASNKSAIGARVYVKATIGGNPVKQMHEISSCTGMYSMNSLNAEFGLGNATLIDSITVKWPSGRICYFTNLSVDKFYTIDEDCEYFANSIIAGKVYNDMNKNCTQDPNEPVLSNRIIKAAPGNLVAMTDSLGNYNFSVPPGTYTLTSLAPKYWQQNCPATSLQVVVADSNGTIYGNNNFAQFITKYCTDLSVDIAVPIMRRCFSNNHYVSYCNKGTKTAISPVIAVEFDTDLQPQSSTLSWDSIVGRTYYFSVDSIVPGECGNFAILTYLSCNALWQQTKCVTAIISPATDCIVPLNPGWDKSSVKVVGRCVNDSLACFAIYNTGEAGNGDMKGTSEYRVYIGDSLIAKNNFQIAGGDSLVVCIPANGETILLQADQRPGHPGKSRPNDFVESCGDPAAFAGSQKGVILLFGEDDEDKFIETECRVVTGSYDPNDKSVKPIGVSSSHLIDSTVTLDYHINFQNTGNDTAFTVVIKDTLSPYLDITTVEPGTSSHPYIYTISGTRTLTFRFNNILLPDSNVNEPASHGFVKFKVQQVKNNPYGTVIENTAGIYFDFNAPVITNTVSNTIGKPSSVLPSAIRYLNANSTQVSVYPNPMTDQVVFSVNDKQSTHQLLIYDALGNLVRSIQWQGENVSLDKENMSSGLYLFRIINNNQTLVGSGKLIVE